MTDGAIGNGLSSFLTGFAMSGGSTDEGLRAAGQGFTSALLASAANALNPEGKGIVPEKGNPEMQELQAKGAVMAVAPGSKPGSWAIALLEGNGFSHIWDARDTTDVPQPGRKYVMLKTSPNVQWVMPNKSYNLCTNNCSTRYSWATPGTAYSDSNYVHRW
jgi:hypothetical protein